MRVSFALFLCALAGSVVAFAIGGPWAVAIFAVLFFLALH
jgi:hypothetical protein